MNSASPPRSRVVSNVAAACLANFSAYVPITAVAVALPTIQRGLHASTSDLTWVLDAFVIPMAAFILSAGTLGDLIGRRRMLLGGLVLVIVGSGLGLAAKSSIDLLWAAQATAGTGAAILLPTSLAVISHAIPDPRRRAPAVGVWASTLAVALAAGPWLSTLVIDTIGAHWQWLYAAMLPWPVLALGVGAWGVDESRVPEGRGFDLGGQLAGVAFVVSLVYGVIQGPSHGWGSALVVSSFAVAAVAFTALIAIERKTLAPMLPRGLFVSPAFSVTGVVAALLMFGLIGTMFLLSLFFGSIQHLQINQIALRLLPLFVAVGLLGPFSARVSERIGPLPALTAGLIIAAGGLASLTGLHLTTTFGGLWWRMALIGVGFGLVFSPMTAAAVSSVPHALAGLAGSANSAFRQVGGALGPAVLGAVLTGRFTSRLPSALVAQHVPAATAARVSALVGTHGTAALGSLPRNSGGRPILHAAGDAFSSGLHTAVIIAAIALAAAVIPVLGFLRRRGHEAASSTPAAAPTGPDPATAQLADAKAHEALRVADAEARAHAEHERRLEAEATAQSAIDFAEQLQHDRDRPDAHERARTAERLARAAEEIAVAQRERADAERARAIALTAQQEAEHRAAELEHRLAALNSPGPFAAGRSGRP